MTKPIALITDFGTRDPSVGIMKSVILRICPDAMFLDLGHEVPPGDVPQAAFALAMAFPWLPEGTVCVAVVDPGVGTDRRAVAVEIGGRVVVGPDNGLVSWLLVGSDPARAVELADTEYHLPRVSSTFQGRDVFAPVAAHISRGVALDKLGPAAGDLVTFPLPGVVEADNSIQGEIVYVDRFGNLLTNITRTQFENWIGDDCDILAVHFGSVEIRGISRAYADVPPGHPAVLFGSSDVLEISVNGGNAEYSLGASVGSHILILKME